MESRMTAAVLTAALLAATPAAGQTVVDGDTIKLDGAAYRLWGIDAPETRQACADGWPAGIEAKRRMAELINGRAVTCEPRDRDRYGRTDTPRGTRRSRLSTATRSTSTARPIVFGASTLRRRGRAAQTDGGPGSRPAPSCVIWGPAASSPVSPGTRTATAGSSRYAGQTGRILARRW